MMEDVKGNGEVGKRLGTNIKVSPGFATNLHGKSLITL